ncbi:wee1-like protein kinase [Nasonia vitripennis]|uniref:Protein kinase domain-containing protein n=1 Tax=Nasonia vitripennis TaxID=7425 RepID=A0A7M7LJX7_NASVI|nr:wee1-like protein kinase [Nasonia vitripennis]
MACVNALCCRLKKFFLAKKAQQTKRNDCAHGKIEESVTGVVALTVNVNPFVPADDLDISWVKIEKEEIVNEESKSRSGSRNKKKHVTPKIRKALCFSSTESAADDSSLTSCLSFSQSSTKSIKIRIGPATRYHREFQELELIGSGEFGTVFRCVNRVDGCVYAIKRSRPLSRSKFAQRRVSNEVHANAVLSNYKHVVRYYSAWIENDCMSIQQEYCDGGDLAGVIATMNTEKTTLTENKICRMILHVAKGLRYIHGFKLAHLDIKPENIFLSTQRVLVSSKNSDDYIEEVVYKIGDLGHVTSIANVQELEDEGDCRYLAKEILREDYSDLTKADIFSLGLTIFEACGGGPLPKNGPKWQEIREGKLDRLAAYSDDINELVMSMIHAEPKKRPSASNVLRRDFLLNAFDAVKQV